MQQSVRTLLLIEAVVFLVAALVHSGQLIDGYQHREARIAETVIAAVLVIGLVVARLRPSAARAAGLAAQAFALLGTLVGIFTIIVGVGPRTVLDVTYHVGVVILLAFGLVVVARRRNDLGVGAR